MPSSVIVAVASSLVAESVAAYAVFELGFGAVATMLVKGATSFLVGSALKSALGGGAESSPTASPSFTAHAEQRTHVIRSSVANRQIIYGRAKVSGPLVFAASSADNNTLHLVVALAGHEIDAVEAIYLNDELSTDAKFTGYVTTAAHLGAADQVADADLVTAGLGWTADHRLHGIAYLYVKLTYSRDVFPRGIPNISAVVRGKKLYDPRTATTVWSQNLALAVRDYLAGTYGLSSTDAEINDTALIAAANICDETVTLAAGGTEARYTVNGVLDTGGTPRANMEALLSGCGGALTWPAGLWTLHVGAYESPTVSLAEDDLAGAVQVRARVSRQDLYNGLKGTFVDPTQDYQPVDFPAITNSAYATQDGAQIFRDVAFPVTTSSATAQRLAKMMVEKSRQGITVQAPFKLTAFKVSTWDNIELSIASLGWTDKVFKVTGWGFNEAGSISLTLQEEAAACYTWSAEETIADAAPDTALPDSLSIAAPGVPSVTESLFETTGSAGVKARATMGWVASTDAFALDYLPEYRLTAGTWIALPATTAASVEINDIAPGIYEFRLRARNTLGVRSDYSGTRTQEIAGLTAPPADVTGFYVVPGGGQAWAQWTLHADLDVRIGGRITVRHSSLATGAAWEDGVVLREFAGSAVGGPLPLLAGTYMAKAMDSSGNWSEAMVAFYASADFAHGWTTAATLTESPAFAGAKTDVARVSSALQLDSATPIDSMTALIDLWDSIDSIGGIEPSGSYAFSSTMDLTTVAVRNFVVDLTAAAFDTGDLIDSRTTEIDYWDSTDGATINDCTVTPYIRVTPDDPAGSPTWGAWMPFWVADVNCRAAQFRLDFQSGNRSHNISVSALAVRAREFA